MYVNARRAAKLTLLVSDLQDSLEEHMQFVDIGLIKNSYQMRSRLNLMRQ